VIEVTSVVLPVLDGLRQVLVSPRVMQKVVLKMVQEQRLALASPQMVAAWL